MSRQIKLRITILPNTTIYHHKYYDNGKVLFKGETMYEVPEEIDVSFVGTYDNGYSEVKVVDQEIYLTILTRNLSDILKRGIDTSNFRIKVPSISRGKHNILVIK